MKSKAKTVVKIIVAAFAGILLAADTFLLVMLIDAYRTEHSQYPSDTDQIISALRVRVAYLEKGEEPPEDIAEWLDEIDPRPILTDDDGNTII